MAYLFAAATFADVTTSGFIHLQVSVVRSRRSSDQTLFVRTHVAMYFFCLLFCDFFQGIGALLNIPWIVDKRAYIGSVCTAQATIKQFGNVREACSLQQRVNIDAFHGLRLEQRFFLLSSQPTPSAYSFFVGNGLLAHATSSSSPHGVSSCSTCASEITSLPTTREDHTMEYLATGAGSHPRTR